MLPLQTLILYFSKISPKPQLWVNEPISCKVFYSDFTSLQNYNMLLITWLLMSLY